MTKKRPKKRKPKPSKPRKRTIQHDIGFFAIIAIAAVLMTLSGLYLNGWRFPPSKSHVGQVASTAATERQPAMESALSPASAQKSEQNSPSVVSAGCAMAGAASVRQHRTVLIDENNNCSLMEPEKAAASALPLPQHKPQEDVDPATAKLNHAEVGFVDDRSAAEARELGRQMIDRFCNKHPLADACKNQDSR